VSFPLVDEPGKCMVAWTTTPWTLPSNLAVCVHPTLEYHLLQEKGNDGADAYWIVKTRVEAFSKWTKKKYTVLQKCPGKDLEGKKYEPLFKYFYEAKKDTCWKVLVDEYVTSDAGTGTVHQAPAFGEDDNRVCIKAGLCSKTEVICPIDANGRFTEEVPDFKGLHIKEADKGIIKHLKDQGRVLFNGTLKHSYPFCWRSETPLIYRVVPSFFVNVESVKDRLIANNESPQWVPGFVKEKRFHNWLKDARDWCISRNRYWGCPLPLWRSDDGKEEVCVGSVAELEELSGVTGLTDIHKDIVDTITITSKKTGKVLRRVEEVFDCWFESGSMPYASYHYPFENKEFFEEHFPADFIAEGLDQTRGWFYTLMVLSTCLFDKPAFQNNIVNGLVLAGDGKKMSKRLKNYDDPMKVVNANSADALRLYLINSPVVRAEPLCFKTDGVYNVVKDVFLPWYNAYRFLVQSVEAFELKYEQSFKCVFLEGSKLNVMDSWLQAASQSLIKFVRQEVDGYRLYTVIPRLLSFIEDLTNWYVKLNRTRLKGDEGTAQEVQQLAISNLADVLTSVSIVMAPFTPHISELMYQNLRLLEPEAQREDSVHFKLIPEPNEALMDDAIETAVSHMQAVIVEGRKIRDRRTIGLKTPLKSITVVHREQSFLDSLVPVEEYILKELNVKQVKFSTDENSYVSFKAVANRKNLGSRLGKQSKAASDAVSKMNQEEMMHYLSVKDADGITLGEFTFTGDDIGVQCAPKEGLSKEIELSIDMKTNTTVVMDLTIDESQAQAALARDFMSKVQKLRKSSGLREQDVIEVFWSTTDRKLQEAIEKSDNLSKGLKVPTVAPLAKMPSKAVPLGSDKTDSLTIVLTRVAAVVNGEALESKYGKRIADALYGFVASMDYSVLSSYLTQEGSIGISLDEINYPNEDWPKGEKVSVQLELGKTIYLSTGQRLSGAPPAAQPQNPNVPKADADKGQSKAEKKKDKKGGASEPAAAKEAQGGKKAKAKKEAAPAKKNAKKDKEPTPEDLAKAAAKKEKAVIKEGGKKGVEIEGACDMGGMQFFCTQLDEPDGDMDLLEKGFAAMNAEADPTEEERKGGAGNVGKVVFSAGSQALLMICNVPEDKLTDTPAKEEGAPPMKAVAADQWLKSILGKFAKDYPGAEILPGSNSKFAKCSLPANEEKRLFPVKLKDDAMSYAYAYLNERNCMPADDDSDDDYIPQGDFQLEDY